MKLIDWLEPKLGWSKGAWISMSMFFWGLGHIATGWFPILGLVIGALLAYAVDCFWFIPHVDDCYCRY